METIYIILGLIMLVFGILQIILFFKLWKMTNDVHAIKENKPVDKNTFWELRKYILLNNVEKAEEIVLAIFLNNVRKDIAANGITGCNVEKWKAECQAYYKAIGKNIPESILKIHSGIDVIQLVH